MSLPTPYVLQVRRRQVTGKDSRGNDIVAYGDPVPWPVHGYASGANDEPDHSFRDLSMILWTVFAPVSELLPRDRDVVVLGGEEFMVDGMPRDYSRGPWPFPDAGVAVYLVRAEG